VAANLTLSSDAHGGTIVNDPPVRATESDGSVGPVFDPISCTTTSAPSALDNQPPLGR
jgi:hypothetical protein